MYGHPLSPYFPYEIVELKLLSLLGQCLQNMVNSGVETSLSWLTFRSLKVRTDFFLC